MRLRTMRWAKRRLRSSRAMGLRGFGAVGFLVFIFPSSQREKRRGRAAPAVASHPNAASSAAADWRDTPVLGAAGGS